LIAICMEDDRSKISSDKARKTANPHELES
jgi:hypothetical protein